MTHRFLRRSFLRHWRWAGKTGLHAVVVRRARAGRYPVFEELLGHR